jgi:LysM repeat protein
VQIELTIHEVKTSIDDLRHDMHCVQAQLQIIDDKVKEQENNLTTVKQQQVGNAQAKVDVLMKQIAMLENKLASLEKKHAATLAAIEEFSNKANMALSQHKDQLNDMQKILSEQNKKFEGISNLRTTLTSVAKNLKIDSDIYVTYKVKSGDSLDKIARSNKVSIDEIKKINHMDNDLIVVGQNLKLPAKR